jgi:hypothetical protein
MHLADRGSFVDLFGQLAMDATPKRGHMTQINVDGIRRLTPVGVRVELSCSDTPSEIHLGR